MDVRVNVEYDDLGHIIDIDFVEDTNDLDDDSIFQSSIDPVIESIIEHAGVKGMKWGVRRSTNKPANSGKPSWAKPPPKPAQKNPSRMSDKQLRDAVNRMRLEQQFKELSAQTVTVSRGQRFLKEAGNFLASSAVEIAKNEGKKFLAKSVENSIEDIMFKRSGRSPASSLSDKALKDSVTRAKLERAYRKNV